MTETAEEALARIQETRRRADRNYRRNHPDKVAAYRKAYNEAGKALREAHRSEYDAIVATLAADGVRWGERQRLALIELRKRHQDEWPAYIAEARS